MATPTTDEAILGDAASITVFGNNLTCNFVDFHPIITGAVTDTVQKKTGKNSLDGKTLLHSPSYYYYIKNEEADRI